MNTKTLAAAGVPALALGAAFLLVAPKAPLHGFSKTGSDLGPGQRDFRVFDNFSDSASNNNNSAHPMFPGWFGVEMAM